MFSLITILVFAGGILSAKNKFTLVIDAGHGGKDHGAPGSISNEKDLTLKMALAFGQMVERQCPDVKVVYTRKKDVYLKLFERADIANRNKADLFVSIHINAMPSRKIAHGFQTYTLGRSLRNGNSQGIQENLEVAKRENSVILMEKDYKQTYQGFDPNSPESNIMFEFIQDKNMEQSVDLARMMQRNVCAATGRVNAGAHQDNLAVLRLTSMPGCLIELGFISTPDEEQFLNSSEAPGMYARGILAAFMEYRNKYDHNISVPYKTTTTDAPNIPNIVPDTYKTSQGTDHPAPEPPKPQATKAARSKNTVVEQPVVSNTADLSKPVFKVQILASSRPLKAGDKRFNGLEGYQGYQEGGLYKYTYGSSDNYNEISNLRKSILNKFPQAFIVAFKNGERMNINQAIHESRADR